MIRARTVPRACSAFYRAASDFTYVRAGRAPRLRHEAVWDESQRGEEWAASRLPRVAGRAASADTDSNELSPAAERARVRALRAAHGDAWPVALLAARLERLSGVPLAALLPADEASALLAPPTEAERAEHASSRGMWEASSAARERAAAAAAALGELEVVALDGGLGGADVGGGALPLSSRARAAGTLALAAAHGTLGAALGAVRAVALSTAAHVRAAGGGEASASADASWEEALGVGSRALATAERSPRIPADFFETWDEPLIAPMTPGEAADEGLAPSSTLVRTVGMEHRDRAEFLSRARLPPALRDGAPTPTLAAAADALDANASLSPSAREAMLSRYADIVGRVPGALNFDAEHAAYVRPQPQWGFYDPRVADMKDATVDAMAGRGAFSAYRGSTWEAAAASAARTGLGPVPHDVAGGGKNAPLETHEEANLGALEAQRRAAAESARAAADITTALERAMGLKPRRTPRETARPFFARHAAGERPEKPTPPTGGHRFEVARQELEKPESSMKKGKDAKGGKGGAKK